MSSPMPGSSETGETGGESAAAGNRAYTSRKSRSSRLSRAFHSFATNRHGSCWLLSRLPFERALGKMGAV